MRARLEETCIEIDAIRSEWHAIWNDTAAGVSAHEELSEIHILHQSVSVHLTRAWLSLETALRAIEGKLPKPDVTNTRAAEAPVQQVPPATQTVNCFDPFGACSVHLTVECKCGEQDQSCSCRPQRSSGSEAFVRDWNRTLGTSDVRSRDRADCRDEIETSSTVSGESVEVSVPVEEPGDVVVKEKSYGRRSKSSPTKSSRGKAAGGGQ